MRRPTSRVLCLACCGLCFASACQLACGQNQSGVPQLGQDQAPLNSANPTPPPPTPVAGQVASPGQIRSFAAPPGQIEPLVRGPVHEGFAEMVRLTPEPTPPVAGQPPQPINELPADVRPDSPNAEWLAGYWGWDGTSNRFIWVSGTWRVPPPGDALGSGILDGQRRRHPTGARLLAPGRYRTNQLSPRAPRVPRRRGGSHLAPDAGCILGPGKLGVRQWKLWLGSGLLGACRARLDVGCCSL